MSARWRLLVLTSTIVALCTVVAGPAGAQEADDERAVTIAFDVGDHDAEAGDWPITVVHVTGDLEPGVGFTVELRDDDGAVVWSGDGEFTAPTTSLTVDELVVVGAVTEAAVSQALPDVAGDVVTRPEPEILQQGSGGGGGGQLALSMVVAVILVAILFRSPLPSASTQRWTK